MVCHELNRLQVTVLAMMGADASPAICGSAGVGFPVFEMEDVVPRRALIPSRRDTWLHRLAVRAHRRLLPLTQNRPAAFGQLADSCVPYPEAGGR